MRCQEIQVLLAERGELSTQEEQQVRAHLHGCQQCTQVAARIERARRALRSLPTPPARLPGRVNIAIDALVTSEKRPRRSRTRLVLAATVLAALLLGLVLERDRFLGTPEPGNTAATPVPTTAHITFGAAEEERATYQPLIDRFNQTHPTVRVEFVPLKVFNVSEAKSVDDRLRRVAGTADVLYTSGPSITNAYVRDLQPLIEADPTMPRDEFLPGLFESLAEEGGIYKLPRLINVRALSYNKQRWAEAGLPAPSNDWSWVDLRAAAQQLARKQGDEIDIYGYADSSFPPGWIWEELGAAGLDMNAFESGQIPLSSPEVAAAFTQTAEQVQRGTFYLSSGFIREEDLISSGHMGSWRNGPLVRNRRKNEFEEGVVAYPHGVRSGLQTESYYISGASQQVEAAWTFISFLSRQELDTASYKIPARGTPEMMQRYWQGVDPAQAAAVQAMLARLGPGLRFEDNLVGPSLPVEAIRYALGRVKDWHETPQVALAGAQVWLDEQLHPPTPTPTIQLPTPLPTTTPTPGGKVMITFAASERERARYQPLLDRFNQENSDLHAQFMSLDIQFDAGDNVEGQRHELASLADVLLANGVDLDPRHLQDLRPFMQADPSFDPGAYLPGLFDALTNPDGTIYKLPRSLKSDTILYNKQLWAEAGLPPPSNDWTWADFTAAAQAMSRTSGATINTYGFLDWDRPWDLVQQELEQEGIDTDALQQDRGDVDLTRPEFEQALRRLAEHRTSGTFKSVMPYELNFEDTGDQEWLVSEGKVGMWRADYIPSGAMPSFKIGVLAQPRGWDGGLITTSYAISRVTGDAEASWRLISFLSRQPLEAQDEYDQPALADQALQEHFWSLVREAQPGSVGVEHEAALRAQLGRLGPNTRLDQDSNGFGLKRPESALLTVMERVFLWHEDAAAALAKAQEELDLYQRMPTPTIPPLVRATPVPTASAGQ